MKSVWNSWESSQFYTVSSCRSRQLIWQVLVTRVAFQLLNYDKIIFAFWLIKHLEKNIMLHYCNTFDLILILFIKHFMNQFSFWFTTNVFVRWFMKRFPGPYICFTELSPLHSIHQFIFLYAIHVRGVFKKFPE